MNLNFFNTTNLFEASTSLFQQLGIKLNSNTTSPLPVKDLLKHHYKDNDTYKAIEKTYYIGTIEDSVFKATGLFDVKYSHIQAIEHADKNYDGLMLFALELNKQPTRTEISELTRTFNRISQKMPVALVLKYPIDSEAIISIAISERFKYRQNWRQGEKAGKVIILRDIHTLRTHAGHERILLGLVKPAGITNYAQLHTQWLEALDVNILNKKFFQELANWYFWAMDNVQFPDDIEKKEDVRNATNLIRLITRVIFIWFIKEKNLVPVSLFNEAYLQKILKDFKKINKSSNYYQAILQNLFFGTLNQKMDERDFAEDHNRFNKEDQGIKTKYRYPDKFTISKKEIIQLFENIPFLNGGLFDCLDKFDEEKLEKGKKEQLFVDGFTRLEGKQAIVPDFLFFGEVIEVDLTKYYDPEAKKAIKKKVKGLINTLNNYKFTVTENTPIEEEIALDPELLGKVFENLLASYNPETRTTARKQTGSFYTPREIVNYMVDESLIENLKQNTNIKTDDVDTRLRNIFCYNEEGNPFNSRETDELILAINNAKILDPACGSGAFPMGVLHKMVHILRKLDPGNVKWKAQRKEKIIGTQIKELEKDKKTIEGLSDKAVREKATKAVEERLKEVEEIFESKNNFDDYARKLYLIEDCIYGIDIQPIAVQISKLRFFISLIIDQDKDSNKDNLGFRSLPNLETKFVAANTLISLDKPTLATGDIFIQDKLDAIRLKSEQLKEIRHRYFSAKLRKEKLQFQSEDKKLRKEISEILIKIGHTKGNAYNIASFDPYDQNHFANWFEPEWMFGNEVKEGFDVVIGNPPYIFTRDADFSNEFKNHIASNYFSYLTNKDKKSKANQSGKINLFALFILKGLFVSQKKGIVTYIVPNNLLRTTTYDLVRKYILENSTIEELVDLGSGVFSNVTASTIIFRLSNEKNISNHKCKILNNIINIEKQDYTISTIEQNQFLKNTSYTFNLFADRNVNYLLNKISDGKNYLGNFCIDIIEGIVAHKHLISESNSINSFPLLEGKNIKRYGLHPLKKFINWNTEEIHRTRPDYLWNSPKKIIIQRISGGSNPLTATIDTEKHKTFASINNLLLNMEYSNHYEFILALINSKIINWFYANSFSNNSELTVNISKTYLEKLPIIDFEKDKNESIKKLVVYVLLLKRKELDSKYFERLIDAAVYELYLPEEIRSGGAEVLKYLNNLPELAEGQNEQNLKTIEKVYKELSDPKHPISAALLKLLTIEEVNIIEGRK